jgi:hypothetical protein
MYKYLYLIACIPYAFFAMEQYSPTDQPTREETLDKINHAIVFERECTSALIVKNRSKITLLGLASVATFSLLYGALKSIDCDPSLPALGMNFASIATLTSLCTTPEAKDELIALSKDNLVTLKNQAHDEQKQLRKYLEQLDLQGPWAGRLRTLRATDEKTS